MRGHPRDAEAIPRLACTRHGGALDPVTTRLLTIDSGARTRALTQRGIHQVVQGLAPGWVPMVLTDGFKEDATALLSHDGHWGQPPRRQVTGPTPKPRWRPWPAPFSAHVVQSYRRRRIVRVNHRVVVGPMAHVKPGLSAYGWQITPACVERLPLDLRPHGAAIG